MKLRHLSVSNFRGIEQLDLSIGDDTVLIGENNGGKTAVLLALKLCLKDLGPRRSVVFNTFDFHLKDSNSEPSSANPIDITLTFSEDETSEWSDQQVRRFGLLKVLQVGDDDRQHLILNVTCKYDDASRDFQQEWSFLNLKGEPLTGVPPNALGALQHEVEYFYLSALRDAARHFDAKGPFWRPFLKDGQLPEEQRADIEERLREVNDLVVSSHTGFELAQKRLERLQEVVPFPSSDIVSIEAVPGRVFDMLAKAQIYLGTSTGGKVPVGRHGEGSQSLAVLMLFSAFLDNRSGGESVVAIEEPEAHLHPSAVRALWGVLAGIPGQKLISTHSGDLLSEVDVHSLRRLCKTRDGIRAYRIEPGLLSPEETRKFNYHVRHARGELLFARCWLLVEGETEAWIYPAAARASSLDLHRLGVRVVEYSQSDLGLLAKVANALGIQWFCVADDDSGRTAYEKSVEANLDGSAKADRVAFPYTSMEIHLLGNGYDAIYAQFMPDQNLARVTASQGAPGYWDDYASHLPSKAKTRGAAAAAALMEQRGASGVTPELLGVLNKVASLAEAPQ